MNSRSGGEDSHLRRDAQKKAILKEKKDLMGRALKEGYCVQYHGLPMVVKSIKGNGVRMADAHEELDLIGFNKSGNLLVRAHAVDLEDALERGHLGRLPMLEDTPVKNGAWLFIDGQANQVLDTWVMRTGNTATGVLGEVSYGIQTRMFMSGRVHPQIVDPMFFDPSHMSPLDAQSLEQMEEKLRAHERALNHYGYTHQGTGRVKPYAGLHI